VKRNGDASLHWIEERCASGRICASWQRAVLAELGEPRGRQETTAAMLERCLTQSQAGEPVHQWPAGASE